jgi:hypothetical protein
VRRTLGADAETCPEVLRAFFRVMAFPRGVCGNCHHATASDKVVFAAGCVMPCSTSAVASATSLNR